MLKLRLLSRLPMVLVCLLGACASKSHSQVPTTSGLTQIEAQTRSRFVSNVDYDLQFELSATEDLFRGRTEVHFDLAAGAPALFLDFQGGKVSSLEINGTATSIEHDGQRLPLAMSALKVGRNVVQVTYEHEHSHDGSGFHRFTDPGDQNIYLYTDLQPFDSNRVFPNFDQPDLRARYRIRATAPKTWELVTYALPEKVSRSGETRVWNFPWSERFSTYIFSLHAGPYRVWESKAGKIPLRLFARQSLADKVEANEWFKITQQGFGFFESYFGYPYPFKKYDQILVPEFNAGAMENVAAVTFSEWNVFRSKPTLEDRESRADVILHEMAHMWFGNLVTMRWWDGLWLNESFATYLSSIALTRATEFKGAWRSFYSSTKGWAYWSDELVTTHPIQTPVANTNEAFANFDGITYGKGASSLKQLHFLIGEDAFQRGLKNYFQRYAYKNTELKDFISTLEEASGRSLSKWVDDWLMTAGLNTLKAQWACENAKLASLEISQGAPRENPTLREHQSRVAFLSQTKNGLSVTSAPTINYQTAKSTHPLPTPITCPVAVYPNYEDHDFTKVMLDAKTLEVAKKDLARVQDPWLRNMMAQSLWNMVRDGEWALPEYLKVIYAYLPEERDERSSTAVTETLGEAGSYLTRARAQSRGEASLLAQEHAFERFLFERLGASPAGSDAQATYFESFASFAKRPESQKLMREWLANRKVPKGLSFGQDRRWRLVRQLNHLGVVDGDALIQNELKIQDDDFAQKAVLSARAQRPDPATKTELWKRLVEGSDSLDDQKHILYHLFPADQKDLHETWAAEFFRILPELARTRDEEFLSSFVDGLVPATCTPASVSRLAAFVKTQATELSHSVMKDLRIALQEDERCVKILTSFAAPRAAPHK